MSGSERSVTVHEYPVIRIPAFASVTPRLFAMSVRRPTGMNSDVLTRKADTVSPISGSHSLVVIFSSFISLSSCYQEILPQ